MRVSNECAERVFAHGEAGLDEGVVLVDFASGLLDARARVKELGGFVVWLFQEWGVGGDIDGGALQDEMEKRGLAVPHVVTAEETTEESDWGEGDTIYVLSPELEALRGEEER